MNALVVQTLQSKGIKATPMRMLVLEQLLLRPSCHITLAEMEIHLHPADRVTIYRTLQTFLKFGVAHSISSLNGTISYALCDEDCDEELHNDNHPHFYCERCRKTICSSDFKYSLLSPENSQYQIKDVKVLISGICPDCARD